MTLALPWRTEHAPALLREWECAGATVQGRDHAVARRNSQDAIEIRVSEDAIVAVLCDGCGSARHSETGARLLATLLAGALTRGAAARDPWRGESAIEAALDEVLESLAILARVAGGGEAASYAWLAEHLLATVLGVVVTRSRATVFRLGDGIVGVNGHFTTVEMVDNAPPYLAYRLLHGDTARATPPGCLPVIEWEGPSDALESVVLATDGAACLPATDVDPHATLRGWLGDDALYSRPHALSRRLTLLARDEQVIDWDERVLRRRAGALADDTTVLLLRRCCPARER